MYIRLRAFWKLDLAFSMSHHLGVGLLAEIWIKPSILFMQISTNGLILFDTDDEFQSYTVSCFPRVSRPYLPLVAPLWADFNFRDSGTIFYRLVSDSGTLDAVADVISNLNSNYMDFRPTLAVIVTWFQSELLRSEVKVSL